MIIGITGIFGSGKTIVAKMMSRKGAAVLDADVIAKMLYNDKSIREKIAKEFGTTDTRKIADIVFVNRGKLNKLNKIIHPLVIRKMKVESSKYRNRIIVWDAPLLIEAKMHDLCDKVIVVSCPEKECIKRLERKGFDRKQTKLRMKSQLTSKQKMKYADYIVDNSSSLANTKRQVDIIWKDLQS